MLDINSERQTIVDALIDQIDGCSKCSAEFYGNVATIADDDGNLTTEQLKACSKHLTAAHVKHVH